MKKGYVIFISCDFFGEKRVGVVAKEDGSPIFTKEEADQEILNDSMNFEAEYRVICINDFFEKE